MLVCEDTSEGISFFTSGFASAFTSDLVSAFCGLSLDSLNSITRILDPCLTLSPTFKSIFVTLPSCVEGISIDALSDSTVMSESSFLIVSPILTITSMTSTLSKLPISGTVI